MLNLPVDDMIHCPKERQPCGSARLLLLSQLQVLSKQGTNPFECTGSDFERAHPSLYLLDSDHEEDRDIEIGWTMFTLFHIKYCSSIKTQIVKLRTSTRTCFCFLKLKWSVTILLFPKSKLHFKRGCQLFSRIRRQKQKFSFFFYSL